MDGIVREFLAGSPLECIGPGVLGQGPIGNLDRIGGIPGVGVIQELFSQNSILGIPVHQSAFCRINGVGILVRVKGRPIGGGHIPHRQVEICRVHRDGATAGDLIVSRSIAAVTSLYLCTGSQVLVFILAYMGRIVAAFARGISAISRNGILDIAVRQSISVHQLIFVVRRHPIGHCRVAIGLGTIGDDIQCFPGDFHFPIIGSLVIPVQGLDPILIGHIHHIEGFVPISGRLIRFIAICICHHFIPAGPGSCLRSAVTGCTDHSQARLRSVRTGHIGQITGFIEVFEAGDIDVIPAGILIGSLRGQRFRHRFFRQGIPIGLGSITAGNGDHRSHLENELVAAGILIVRKGIAGTVAEYRAVGIGFGGPLGIGAADQVIAQAGTVVAGGIHIDLPGASGASGDGICASGAVHQGTMAALSIHHNGPFCCASRGQGPIGSISIVVHPGPQSDPAFISGGSEADFAAMESVVTVRIPIGCYPVDRQITGRFDSHIIQLEGGILIPIGTDGDVAGRRSGIRSAGMDFPAYGDGPPGKVDPMVRIDGSIFVVGGCILFIPDGHSPGAFDIHRIQGLALPDIPFQADSASAGFDVQAGIGQVGFLDEAHGGIPAHGRIVPFASGAIPYGQERCTVVRLGTGLVPVFIGIPVHIPINGFPIIPRLPVGIGIAVKLGPLSIVGFPFGTGDPVHPILIGRIIGHAVIGIGVGLVVVGRTGFVQYAGSPATGPEDLLSVGRGQGVFQDGGDGGQVGIPYGGTPFGISLGQFFGCKPVGGQEMADVILQVVVDRLSIEHLGGIGAGRITLEIGKSRGQVGFELGCGHIRTIGIAHISIGLIAHRFGHDFDPAVLADIPIGKVGRVIGELVVQPLFQGHAALGDDDGSIALPLIHADAGRTPIPQPADILGIGFREGVMGLSGSIFLGLRGIFIGPICLLHIIAVGVFYIVDALIMIGRDRAAFQVVFHGLFHQGIPGVRPVYIGPIAVPGVDDPGGRHISSPGIQDQSSPVEADGDFPVEGDLPAAGLDQPVILCPIRCTAAVHMAKIGTDRMARRICLARKGPFPIPFGIG